MFEKNDKARRLVPLAVILVGIFLLAGLAIVITQRMDDLSEAPGDNLTWTLSQVEVDVLILMDEALLTAQAETTDVSDIRRRFDNLYSRTSTLRDAPVFAQMRTDAVFSSQLETLERCLTKLTKIIDSSDAALLANLDPLIDELKRIREEAHAIALTGIGLRSETSDVERKSLARLLFVAAIVSLATILFLAFVLTVIVRQHRLHQDASDAVVRANARLKSTFDVSLDAIVVADTEGVILEFNEAAEAVFGFAASEAVGQEMTDLIVPKHLRAAHTAGMARFNKTQDARLVGKGRIEITGLRKSGEEFPVEISIGMAADHRGTIFISYLRDITERVAAEQDLKSARDEALAAETAKSNFLAVMSHEMRTPLNGIFGTLELLSNSKVTEKQRSFLEIAKRSGDILLHHVNDVLDVSRMDAEKMELVEDSFDLAQFFSDVVTANEATADAQCNVLELQLEKMPKGAVLLDERRMRQVTYNLISNALKFTSNGTVTLRANTFADQDGQMTLEFSVIDTGVGIHAEDQAFVFDRFYTQERSYDRFASGAGLGLAICKQLIDMMGGTISLQSSAGKGSSFTVSLPFEMDEAPQQESTRFEHEVDVTPLEGQEILLVEDNEINRLIFCEMLKLNGMVVYEALNGQEAVDLAQIREYAAILMDVSMPVMNGVDATEIIRSTVGPNQNAKILGLTAHALPDEQARFIAAGMDTVLNKPISQSTLIEALLSVVQANSSYQEASIVSSDIILIDAATFSELEQILKSDLLQRLVSGFEVEITAFLAQIPLLLQQGDMLSLASDTHKSVGSSGMIGAHHFQNLLRELEHAAKAGDEKRVMKCVDDVVSAWPATQSALKAKSYTLG
ncbi:hybrid sensor histidine kinase/response regulator [Sulfitobacter sp. SK012]|uniref:hybrid sensor histidine kinase/response regulator n=1 Tax=Sulfitobacter sp. SK012 TaxID=1389005 RepID=UPI0013B4173C|nr:ATP-binding protein [Sulfitobacter sp. SK012]